MALANRSKTGDAVTGLTSTGLTLPTLVFTEGRSIVSSLYGLGWTTCTEGGMRRLFTLLLLGGCDPWLLPPLLVLPVREVLLAREISLPPSGLSTSFDSREVGC
jgi:hypothetical protein